MNVEQGLHGGEIRSDLSFERRISLLEQRTESLEGHERSVDIGLEVPQVGTRPVLLLAGDLAGRYLVKQATRPVGDLIGAEIKVRNPLLQDRRVLNKIIGVRPTLGAAERLVVLGARRPQIFLQTVPAGPLLTGFEIGLSKVKLGIQIAE